jgi:hypothetical protein
LCTVSIVVGQTHARTNERQRPDTCLLRVSLVVGDLRIALDSHLQWSLPATKYTFASGVDSHRTIASRETSHVAVDKHQSGQCTSNESVPIGTTLTAAALVAVRTLAAISSLVCARGGITRNFTTCSMLHLRSHLGVDNDTRSNESSIGDVICSLRCTGTRSDKRLWRLRNE